MAEAIQEKREWIGRKTTVPNKMADKSESKKTAVSRFFCFLAECRLYVVFLLTLGSVDKAGFFKVTAGKKYGKHLDDWTIYIC